MGELSRDVDALDHEAFRVPPASDQIEIALHSRAMTPFANKTLHLLTLRCRQFFPGLRCCPECQRPHQHSPGTGGGYVQDTERSVDDPHDELAGRPCDWSRSETRLRMCYHDLITTSSIDGLPERSSPDASRHLVTLEEQHRLVLEKREVPVAGA